MIYEKGRDKHEWNLNWERPFPRVLEYKKNDIKEVDTTEFRVRVPYPMIKDSI